MSESRASWVNAKPEEVETKIVALAKEGVSAEKIGLILRDEHGIPKMKLLGIKIKKILEKHNMWKDIEFENKKKKSEKLTEHSKNNKHDYSALRSLSKYNSAISRIEKKR